MQLSVPKESEVGFKITELQNEVSVLKEVALPIPNSLKMFYYFHSQGIFVEEVNNSSAASRFLKKMDKILDIDGVDFTNISFKEACTVLSNSGPILNIMISRI